MSVSLFTGKRDQAATPEVTLRRLFLTLFLRGQSARGLTKQTAPVSIFRKMWSSLLLYGLIGGCVVFLSGQGLMVQSLYLHAITAMFLAMFVAAAAGEALFNKEESEILMHRPLTPQMVLRAKAFVIVQISLTLAIAVNSVGFVTGARVSPRPALWVLAHSISVLGEALFTVSLVILAYQLCLKLCGRERLDSMMTTVQVLLTMGIFVGSQVIPRALVGSHGIALDVNAWWLNLLPPAWFASFDNVIAGDGNGIAWWLAGVAILLTGLLLTTAFGKLTAVYESGAQALNESSAPKRNQSVRMGRLKALTGAPPLGWFLRDSVSRTSFLLVVSYMLRDRDVKLRLYPGIAQFLIMPIVMLFMNHGMKGAGEGQGIFVGIASCYLCLIPLTALSLLSFSQQWRAASVFLAAPISGPGPLMTGARVAVVALICVPMILVILLVVGLMGDLASLPMMLPALLALPVYAMLPSVLQNTVPLSNPQEEAKAVSRFPLMIVPLMGVFGISGLARLCQYLGYLPEFLILEAAACIGICYLCNAIINRKDFVLYD